MQRNVKQLQIEQLDRKLAAFGQVLSVLPPEGGWLHTMRVALGMSLRQLGARLKLSRQGAAQIEQREAAGSITLNTLREAAAAMDMRLVYALVPQAGTLEEMIERRARELALEIVGRTSQSMKLEAQENLPERLEKAVAETAAELKRIMPRYLWD